jgi:hypothetical protein
VVEREMLQLDMVHQAVEQEDYVQLLARLVVVVRLKAL